MNQMSVLEFSPGDSTWNSISELSSTLRTSKAFTMCYRIKIFRFLPSIYWINVATYTIGEDDTCCEMRSMWTGLGPIFVMRNQFIGISTFEVKVMTWYHHCFTYDYSTGDFAMLVDGDVVEEGRKKRDGLDGLKPNGTLHLGANVECGWKNVNCTSEFSGLITDFNVWTRQLTRKEMRNFTMAKAEGRGDQIAWRASKWRHSNVSVLKRGP